MAYAFLAVVSIAALLFVTRSFDRATRREAERRALEAAARRAEERKTEPAKQYVDELAKETISQSAVAATTLSFNKSTLFDSRDVPYCDEDEATFSDILADYATWYEEKDPNGAKTDWLLKAMKRLDTQNDYFDFIFQEIARILRMLEEKGLDRASAPCVGKVQAVLNSFVANRAESLRLLAQIYDASDTVVVHRLKSVLLCLVGDNDELITGLDSFSAGMRHFLAEVCQDKTTDHVTDFTSLNELLQIPKELEKVMAESKARIEAKETEVPTIDFPENTYRSALDYFPNLGLKSTMSAKSSDTITTGTIYNGECGVD